MYSDAEIAEMLRKGAESTLRSPLIVKHRPAVDTAELLDRLGKLRKERAAASVEAESCLFAAVLKRGRVELR